MADDLVREACEACFEKNRGDCSAFVHAVAARLGITLEGQADAIVDTIRAGGGWTPLENGPVAVQRARAGMLVVAGLKGAEQAHPSAHGHVVVVVDGPLNRGAYPTAFWGSLGGEPGDNQTVNWAWTPGDRDRISYAAASIAGGGSAAGATATVTGSTAVPAPAPIQQAAAADNRLPWLTTAIRAAAPEADAAKWAALLQPHLLVSAMTTPRRVAAFLGQAAVEAGPAFQELAENTLYTSAERLCAIFPSTFPTIAVAQDYVGNDQRIACRAYAGRLGNGDEASGDGWLFRGSGLLQITGRDAHEAFAAILEAPVEQVAEWVRSPSGGVASACWFWRRHGLNALADIWHLSEITRAVNGQMMLAHAQRVAASDAALRATGGG